MEQVTLTAQVSQDGILRVELPPQFSQHEVEITVSLKPAPAEKEDWVSFVNRMFGALADDPIERLPQLPLEERDPIE